ncbi:cupin domain-containing protein [Maricaulis sp.]|uniref:cupin domain-containing protein n=1 Tax=unclassified Maricaulis TaxID=2632371 RepID=UPI001B0A405C|nr:cupin domain-containing protein [Maricaulis sp.]MBO6796595.1 cupin domain-containing protein [Maricaulis sp.]
MTQTAQQIIDALDMQRHPEGGWYVETFRDVNGPDGRARSTAIYYLLEAGDRSHWHRVDALEVWHWHAGAPLRLSISTDGKTSRDIDLGPDVVSGQRPQGIVPTQAWQAAQSLGDWTLVGCTVAPGFEFSGFEMAPSEWAPDDRRVDVQT